MDCLCIWWGKIIVQVRGRLRWIKYARMLWDRWTKFINIFLVKFLFHEIALIEFQSKYYDRKLDNNRKITTSSIYTHHENIPRGRISTWSSFWIFIYLDFCIYPSIVIFTTFLDISFVDFFVSLLESYTYVLPPFYEGTAKL